MTRQPSARYSTIRRLTNGRTFQLSHTTLVTSANSWNAGLLTLRDVAEQATEYLQKAKQTSDETLGRLREAQSQSKSEPITVNACPVECIREVGPDSTMVLIGGIWCKKCDKGEFLGPQGPKVIEWEHREEFREENEALELGDPEIVWTIKGE